MTDNGAPLILLTRPRPASERFAARLAEKLDITVRMVIAPLIEIVATTPVPPFAGLAGVIFTSEAAVRLAAMGAPPGGMPAYCVGDHTARMAQDAGFAARSAGGAADDLVALIQDLAPKGRLLHLHGAHTRGAIAERLRAAGLRAASVAIYDQRAVPPSDAFCTALHDPGPIFVPLFSPRSASLFAKAAGAVRPANITLLAMSPAVRDALPAHWATSCRVVPHPTAAVMVVALTSAVGRQASVDGRGPLV